MSGPNPVRIAVIDSGVHRQHPHIGRIAGGITITPDAMTPDFTDRIGHGTAVTAAIQEKAPDAEIYAVRIFVETLRTTTDTLLRAIDWCIEEKMHLINLSLGSLNNAYLDRYRETVARANAANVILVAAVEAQGKPCFPGCLQGVMGVNLDWECGRDSYWNAGCIYYASGYPRPIPGVAPQRNLNGISFAVANITGLAARVWPEQLPLKPPSPHPSASSDPA
jgi:subtilisin family serine protease